MSDYRLRSATTADRDMLVHHRVEMFRDMKLEFDEVALAGAFLAWVVPMMEQGVYKAWLVEDADGTIVGGGGMTIIPWPPGPRYPGERLAFVYNVYTEPAHRHRGLARRIMEAMHAFCRDERITNVALNASEFGQPLYASMGYQVTTSPMMFLSLE